MHFRACSAISRKPVGPSPAAYFWQATSFGVTTSIRARAHHSGAVQEAEEFLVSCTALRQLAYCVTVFAASPSLNPEPETGVHTDESASTSVTFTTPTGVV